ncbi:DUF4169 family protein [Caulobacter sp. NIBR1757]|uniref:DUF4169 family protein n=1 Tax=Caulobacter sp. NIBR1757 TaxID=3016000 RepID=UPI0022F03878|nr:DUF4169 family protein [Caulobacter sp. NIBR1757]WGM39259.1 hypothetical protein AMEJIAPC_02176 [Caulobacter sp. NIBR1757]
MADLINLNKARKAKARASGKQSAVENRAKFGRTGVDRSLETARKAKVEQALDGAKLTPEE